MVFSVILSGLMPSATMRPHGIDELGPAAVVERDRERHAPVLLGQRRGLVDAAQDAAWAPASPGAR